MTGIGFILPGSGPGVGPILPEPLHVLPVAGYTHRWVAERQEGNVGDTINTVVDQIGEWDLVRATAGSFGTVQIGDQSGYRTIDMIGTMSAPGRLISQSIIPLREFTLIYVGRVDNAQAAAGQTRNFLTYQNMTMSRAANNDSQLGLQSSWTLPGGGNFQNWSIGMIGWDGVANPPLQTGLMARVNHVDDTTWNSWPGNSILQARTMEIQGAVSSSGSNINSMLECIIYDRFLTVAERDSVRIALKARYPLLA